jgi:hypothetical protein
MSEYEGIPMVMQWQIKRLKVLQKETVTMTTNKSIDAKPAPFDAAAGATGLLDNVLARDKGRYCVRS